jgi:hypothetical protein
MGKPFKIRYITSTSHTNEHPKGEGGPSWSLATTISTNCVFFTRKDLLEKKLLDLFG